MKLFDSHCHLDVAAFDDMDGVDGAVARAMEAGVDRMLAIGSGYGFDSALGAVAVAERHDGVWASVGLHPHDARLWTESARVQLTDMVQHPKVIAFGEMGLDFHYDNSPRDIQRVVFRRQIQCALDVSVPIIIHDRESSGETIEILDAEHAWSGGVVFHCFTGDVATMERIVERGGYVSLPGIVTFKNADQMREVARRVPIERLFIETDSPFLTPVPFRGRRNEPARVALVAEAVAKECEMSVEDVAEWTWDNASRFFGIAD